VANFVETFFKEIATGDSIHDWQHASATFVADSYRLAPKYGHLFHVYFYVNPKALQNNPDPTLNTELSLLVKSVSLPNFTVDTKTLNNYNRPNIYQSKIKYEPITLTFHDDSADLVKKFWFDYYSYYYRDSDNAQLGAFVDRKSKYGERTENSWGYSPKGQDPYLFGISIYQLQQKKYTEWLLINPFIESFQGGEQSYSSSETVQITMRIGYESFKLFNGNVSENTVSGFANAHYDKSPSPLTPAGGGTRSILGPGGVLESASEISNDFSKNNFGTGLFKLARTVSSMKGADIKGMIKGELNSVLKDQLRNKSSPVNRFIFPGTANTTGSSLTDFLTKGSAVDDSVTTLAGSAAGVTTNGTPVGKATSTMNADQSTESATETQTQDIATLQAEVDDLDNQLQAAQAQVDLAQAAVNDAQAALDEDPSDQNADALQMAKDSLDAAQTELLDITARHSEASARLQDLINESGRTDVSAADTAELTDLQAQSEKDLGSLTNAKAQLASADAAVESAAESFANDPSPENEQAYNAAVLQQTEVKAIHDDALTTSQASLQAAADKQSAIDAKQEVTSTQVVTNTKAPVNPTTSAPEPSPPGTYPSSVVNGTLAQFEIGIGSLNNANNELNNILSQAAAIKESATRNLAEYEKELADAKANNLPQSEIDGIQSDIDSSKRSIASRTRQIDAINSKKSEIDKLTASAASQMEKVRNGGNPNVMPPGFSISYNDYSNIFNYI
jgi:hypothetical protein